MLSDERFLPDDLANPRRTHFCVDLARDLPNGAELLPTKLSILLTAERDIPNFETVSFMVTGGEVTRSFGLAD